MPPQKGTGRHCSCMALESRFFIFERAALSFPPVTKSDSHASFPFQSKMASAVSWGRRQWEHLSEKTLRSGEQGQKRNVQL